MLLFIRCCRVTEMDADGSSKRSRPVRRAVKKLKFKPKVPPQKPKKLTTEMPQQEEPKPIDERLMKILRTCQVPANSAPNTKDERLTQKPPSTPPSADVVSLFPAQSGVHKQNQSPLQVPRSFPVTVNSGKFDSEESDDDDNEDVEFQDTQPSSIECEASTRPAEELHLLQEQDSKERMFLFQLPKSLPLPRRSSNIVERKGRATGEEVKEGSNLQQLPQGYLGKMLVYKSGKVKMKLGDVMFDVNRGAESRMPQHIVALNTQEKHCCLLGEIEKRHVIVTPDVDSLLNDK
ncbi:DNA-directed RNA polymerase III subunit RPC4-like isoform X3 [Panicum virgatum]|uniref:DNA-directed RNA polymerase III subunit RPC4-like isoform X3 n=1 Tax=Panicum virgatum TaxID=38727 RepID=UPI0019D67932|nr:DNA-directed RNA polymerase III subunit RPC4-like isoform X3 [Panicum virgatum]